MRFTNSGDGGGGRREDLSVRELLYVLWSRRIFVIGAIVVLLAAAMIFTLSRQPTYTAEATINIAPRQQEPSQAEREAFLDETLAVVADDELVAEAASEVGWTGEADFRERLKPESFANQETAGVIVRFTGDTPESAAEAANAYSTLFVEKVERLNERRIAGGTLAAEASISNEAVAPNFRSSPRPLLYALAAVGAGVLVGGAVALLLEGRASSWRDARDAEMTLKAPVLGVIPDYSTLEKDALEKDALEREKP
ncbi:MAG: hypothetical protein H0V75_17125 [Rubrobacter sp.]|nr:hypothetical protein [Rubrobacter sp.]